LTASGQRFDINGSPLGAALARLAHTRHTFPGVLEPPGRALSAPSDDGGASYTSCADFFARHLAPSLASNPPTRQPIGFVTSTGHVAGTGVGQAHGFVRADVLGLLAVKTGTSSTGGELPGWPPRRVLARAPNSAHYRTAFITPLP
jgi:hypothetical protein